MRTTREIVKQINALELHSPHHVEDNIDMDGIKLVADIEPDEHRWYINSTMVFQVGDEFFGVFGPTSLKSESMDWDDCGSPCIAFEMEQVPSVTYRHKKIQSSEEALNSHGAQKRNSDQ